jgi:hypothetical protein
MLSIQSADALVELRCDTYYVQTEWNGADNTLHIQLPARHPQALLLAERTRIYESSGGQVYALCKYNRGKSSTDITAELDLDELCVGMVINWSNTAGNARMTLGATIAAVLPSGWTLVDNTGRTDTQEIDSFCGNPLDLITEAVELWGDVSEVGVQYDNAQRTVTLCSPGKLEPTGAYYTEDLNLLETPTVKYSAARGDYYTRLYMTGADGLTLPSPGYVECKTYDSRTISAYLSDESIEDAATLQAYAQKTVNAAAKVDRSYTCKIVDLAKLDPEKYGWLDSPIYSSIILIDREDQSRSYQTVQRVKTWPHYPEKNEVTLSTVPGTLSSTAQRVYSLARNTANATTAAQSTASDATAKLALWSDTTDSNKIAGGQVAAGTVNGSALANSAVSADKLAGNAVSTAKLAKGAVLNALWTNGSPTSKFTYQTVTITGVADTYSELAIVFNGDDSTKSTHIAASTAIAVIGEGGSIIQPYPAAYSEEPKKMTSMSGGISDILAATRFFYAYKDGKDICIRFSACITSDSSGNVSQSSYASYYCIPYHIYGIK